MAFRGFFLRIYYFIVAVFENLNLPQVRKYILFLLTNNNALIQICHFKKSYKMKIFKTVLRQSCAALCRDSRILCDFYGLIIKICGFAICGLAHKTNLRICNSGMSNKIYGLAICGLLQNVSMSTSAETIVRFDEP